MSASQVAIQTTIDAKSRGTPPEADRRWRIAARSLILVALILEIQMPRVGGLRTSVLVFAASAYVLLLIRVRPLLRNMQYALAWPTGALVVYTAWCFASVAWSSTPTETLLQAGLLSLVLVLALAFADIPPSLFAREFVRVAVWISLMSWAMVAVLPRIAALPDITWRLNGPMVHSQRLALLTGAAIIVFVALRLADEQVFKDGRRDTAAIALLVLTLLATQTRANTVFVLVVVGTLIYARAKVWQKLGLVVALSAFILWLVTNFAWIMGLLDREGSNTLTLTGRTRIWEGAVRMIEGNSTLGYGFASFFSPLTSHFFDSGYIAPHAHNTWVNATFETGLIGAALLSIFLVGALFSSGGRNVRANRYSWPVILFAILCGLMGIVFGGKITTFGVIFTTMVLQAVHESRRAGALSAARGRMRPRAGDGAASLRGK